MITSLRPDNMADFFLYFFCLKFAYMKKKQYLCSMKLRGYINIILIVISVILAKLVIFRAILRILDIA